MEKKTRYYNYSFGELLDRLSILQLKEVFIKENRESYAKEIQEILLDLDEMIKEDNITMDAKSLRALIVISQFNLHIWMNESEARKGNKDGNRLFLTHNLNGIRRRGMNKIQELAGGRVDLKTDCLAADNSDWEPSWDGK